MPRLEEVANVALRVPSIALLDLLYRWDVQALAELLLHPRRTEGTYLWRHHLWNAYYAGHLVCVVVLLLPVRMLVKLYLYILTALLLYVSHQTARDYIRHQMEQEFHGAVYNDPVALSHFATALTGQVIVATLCALLLKTKRVWLFGAPLLPLAARLCCLPLRALPAVNSFATALTAMGALYVAASCLAVPLQWAMVACREVAQVLEVYRLVALGMSLWRQLAVPLLFLVFWLALFTLQIYALASSSSGNPLPQQGLVFIFLSSVAECCSTPYTLIGLTFTVSYLALGLLKLCKFYLAGYSAFQDGNVMHRGVTEGVTLLLLALQTGLLGLQLLERTFLLSIILFIVATSTLQSMIEIADPIVLGLGATRNRSFWKHFRGISMCLFLLVFPGFMAYKIAHFFHMDFWLLILVSSCMLTSLQVMGTLFIYTLFMIELFQDTPMEKMDEIVYYINAISRVLEFLVAVCVVAYGTWESIFGEWSWLGASVIIIHCYFNVWLRAHSGWRSFLLRREAAKKISLLPRATSRQLSDHNDVCAICFQEMTLAVVVPCGHFFHDGCLRKWFFVQDTCPLCHQQVRLSARAEDHARQAEPMAGREEASGSAEPVVLDCAVRPGGNRTAEAGEAGGTEQQSTNSGRLAGEGQQTFSVSGEVGESIPGYDAPQRDLGMPTSAGNGSQALDLPPPKVPPGDWCRSSGEPMAPERDVPGCVSLGREPDLPSKPGNGYPRLSAALGFPAEGCLEEEPPSPVAASPLAAAEDTVEISARKLPQQGDASGGSLGPPAHFDGKAELGAGLSTAFSPP
ncbi:RING finger protein 145 isoform X1 [Zootoca vivipara]|uniref:RING finger protein 145 isoform X1 n=1 Tax=Zootoca vivipara TaxID=8524 RepID=UPI00293C05B9|nr:RING finger protein 145 isoform X1 [Zootoca vivipara]